MAAGEALSKAEVSKAELEVEINKLKSEEATLRDALLKMQALNEGLGQDKIELNRIIMQVRLFNPSSGRSASFDPSSCRSASLTLHQAGQPL